MWKSIAGWGSRRVRAEREKLLAAGPLGGERLLTAERVAAVVQAEGGGWRDCCYSPLVTLWTFLWQVLSADHSCREAVAQLRVFLTADGQTPCDPDSSPYCKARRRLPEQVCARLARDVGRELHERVHDATLLGGRPVKLVDGSTVSMPDTAANQREYPQPSTQKPGLGFPLARIVALLSLASGAALDFAMGPYAGKETGETALFRQLWKSLFSGDIVVGDRYFASYWDLAMLSARRVDSLYRQHQLRLTHEQRIQRLGPGDYLLKLPKPQRPDWMDLDTYAALPAELIVREVRVSDRQRGFRVGKLTLVTTLLSAEQFPAEELVRVYRARWHVELDLRTIKITMQMDVLRCKTPTMVRKEIWMHLLAYNLIRTVMANAAVQHSCQPREISFKGALQTLSAYRSLIETASPEALPDLYDQLHSAIASHRVGNRPDRYEPRAIKRRPKPHDLLTVPRSQAKRLLTQ